MKCWCPDHFTASHREYTNQLCRDNFLQNKTYDAPFDRRLPDSLELKNQPLFNVYDELELSELVDNHWTRRTLQKIIAFELLMVFLFYILISILVSISNRGNNTHSRVLSILGHVAGVLFFLVMSFVPYVSLAQNASLGVFPNLKSGIVMCDFETRHQARIHSYVVQCTYSFEISNQSDIGVTSCLVLNGFVCGAVVIALTGSLLSTLISKPKKDMAIELK